jgi:hypothetical protein
MEWGDILAFEGVWKGDASQLQQWEARLLDAAGGETDADGDIVVAPKDLAQAWHAAGLLQAPAMHQLISNMWGVRGGCRALNTRRSGPNGRQLVLGMACIADAMRRVAEGGMDALHDVDVYYNTRAVTLLPHRCRACEVADEVDHDRAFGHEAREPCCLPLRIGDVVHVPQLGGSGLHLPHPMLYVGYGCILHMTASNPTGTQSKVSIIPLLRQRSARGGVVAMGHLYTADARERWNRLFRGCSCLGQWPYNPATSNCEHFMSDVMRTPYVSVSVAAVAAAVIMCIALGACLICTGHAISDRVQWRRAS